jgi:hypothetical protein
MSEYLKLARVYLVLLAIITIGRFVLGNVSGIPFEKGSDKMSIVVVTIISSILYAAFARAFLGYRMWDAVKLCLTLALCSQVVIFLATVFSYLAGIQSYFNHPTALSGQPAGTVIPLGQALGLRLGGLVVNTLLNGIVGAIGWALGALLPPRKS